ncbi:MAG: hypothetical protein IT426_18590 [Pirellulales bacterium]|nr:hypothetical protein [Pirellulales bacterium]
MILSFLGFPRTVLAAGVAVGLGITSLSASEKGTPMSYGEARDFLAKHTQVIELKDESGARVAITPEYQGRVMTSSCDGAAGASFGFINFDYIKAGELNKHFNNYGGEERLWLSPEGGPFSLWFTPEVKKQTLADWFTPPAFNEGAWKVVPGGNKAEVRMSVPMKLSNASAANFELDAIRSVRLLKEKDLAELFGKAAAEQMTGKGVKRVAYETGNQITNRGPAMTKAKGLVSMWILGMINSGPETVVVVPYKPGSEDQLGPVVKSDYFGSVPADRLKVTPAAVLFRADAKYRAKIGVPQKRAKNVLGSIDYKNNVLTLVSFNMPADPTKELYMNNGWELPQKESYEGDVVNSYNDGPPEPGKKGFGDFYEIESLSPAKELKTGESLAHLHRTIHIQAEPAVLAQLAREILGVEWDAVRKEMLGK